MIKRPIFGLRLLPGDRHITVDIRDIPRKALGMLYRIEPRLLSKEFYDLEPLQRRIMLTPRRMLEAFGSPHVAQQVYGSTILVPQLSSVDDVFKLEKYGSSRVEETWHKWLEACASEIQAAADRRKADQMKVLGEMDQDIEDWITGLSAMGEDALSELVKYKPGSKTWGLDWSKVPLSDSEEDDLAIRRRFKELANSQGAQTIRDFLLMRPETEDLAKAIDRRVGLSSDLHGQDLRH